MNIYNYSQAAIAKFIGRDKSTIAENSKETKIDQVFIGMRVQIKWHKKEGHRHVLLNAFLKAIKRSVLNGLDKGYSPEIISEHLKCEQTKKLSA